MEPLHKIAQILAVHGQRRLASEVAALSLEIKAAQELRVHPHELNLPPEVRGKDPIVPEGTDLAIWTYARSNAITPFLAIAFAAKSSKPLWHHAFRTEMSRDQYIENTAKGRRQALEEKNKRLQERREFKHEFNRGDILVSSWGYDQTNIDYYEVTKVIGPQMIEMRKISKKYVGASGQSDIVMPDPGNYAGPSLRKKVSPNHYVSLNSFSSAHKWDGKPDHQTNSMYGH